MGQLLPGSARATAATRRRSQRRRESLQALAQRHSSNSKTVAKRRSRPTTAGAPMGPKLAPTVRSAEQAAIAVTCRRHALLPLDDYLPALQETHSAPPRARPCTAVFSVAASVGYR